MKVIVLSRDGSYNIIDEEEVQKWLKDGSLSEDDLIVVPRDVFRIVEIRTMGLRPVKLEECFGGEEEK